MAKITLEDHNETFELISQSAASIWPAGDPCPNDRETLVYVIRVNNNSPS